jgi:hypothetical protein
MAALVSITGKPDHGKTTFVCAPYKRFTKIHYIAIEPPALSLRGIPEAWVKGRIKVEQPGYDEKGKRKTGADYYKAMLKYGGQTFDADTIILDTHTGVARNRHLDTLQQMGGIPTEYRRENEAAQVCAIEFLERLQESNQHANLIVLYHRKVKYKPGGDRLIDTYLPELVGTKYDESWGGKFDAILFMQKELEKFWLHLKRENKWNFVFLRKGFRKVEAKMDVTLRSEGELEPAVKAWDEVFKGLGV